MPSAYPLACNPKKKVYIMTYAKKEEIEKAIGIKYEKFGDFACSSCGFETNDLHISRSRTEIDPCGNHPAVFCDVCYETMSGNAHMFPSQYSDKRTLNTMAYCTNMILKTLPKTPDNDFKTEMHVIMTTAAFLTIANIIILIILFVG